MTTRRRETQPTPEPESLNLEQEVEPQMTTPQQTTHHANGAETFDRLYGLLKEQRTGGLFDTEATDEYKKARAARDALLSITQTMEIFLQVGSLDVSQDAILGLLQTIAPDDTTIRTIAQLQWLRDKLDQQDTLRLLASACMDSLTWYLKEVGIAFDPGLHQRAERPLDDVMKRLMSRLGPGGTTTGYPANT